MKKNSKLSAAASIIFAAVLSVSLCGCMGSSDPNQSEQPPMSAAEKAHMDMQDQATSFPTIASAIDAVKQSGSDTYNTTPVIVSGTVESADDQSHSVMLYDGDMSNVAIVTLENDAEMPKEGDSIEVCAYVIKTMDQYGTNALFLHKGFLIDA